MQLQINRQRRIPGNGQWEDVYAYSEEKNGRDFCGLELVYWTPGNIVFDILEPPAIMAYVGGLEAL